jgi:hypothetical protein
MSPRAISARLARGWSATSWILAISAMIPPSPSLSARMISVTYLIETMIVIDQKTSEMTP